MEHKVPRINELARKSKAEGLTPEEAAEQAVLRREYIDAMKNSLRPHLERIRYVDADGNITMPDHEPKPKPKPVDHHQLDSHKADHHQVEGQPKHQEGEHHRPQPRDGGGHQGDHHQPGTPRKEG